ncbi:protein-disulfide reductase DsbD domain-containing protein [Rubritalea tangerina]
MYNPHLRRLLFAVFCVVCLCCVVCVGRECCGEREEVVRFSGDSAVLEFRCDHDVVVPGQEVRVGFFVRHEEGFHTYWKQPGKVGYPLQLVWREPKMGKVPEIDWDLPERVSMNGYAAHGFKRDVAHSMSVQVPESTGGGRFTVELDAGWLACSKRCSPHYQRFRLVLPVGPEAVRSESFAALQKREIPMLEGWGGVAEKKEDMLEVRLWPEKTSSELEGVYLYCESGVLEASFDQEVEHCSDGSILVTAKLKSGVDVPRRWSVLLYAENGIGKQNFSRVILKREESHTR